MSTMFAGYTRKVGPYEGVARDEQRGPKINTGIDGQAQRYRVILYCAYNAMGLIGTEHNGIAVLDNQNRSVVLDNEAQCASGYFGPSKAQFRRFDKLMEMTDAEFEEFCDSHPRSRRRSYG